MQLLNDLQKKATNLVAENASALLTAGGVVGTMVTAILAGRAAYKSSDIIRDEELLELQKADGHSMGLSTKARVKLVWPLYIPPVITGGATIGSIIMANRISAQKAAALAAAYGLSEKTFKEYKDKVNEKLGGKKATDIRDEIQQDRVNAHPPQNVVIIGNGEALCYDAYSDRYFKSSVEQIRQAERAVHQELLASNECSLNEFYSELGLPRIQIGQEVGWNINHSCTVEITTLLAPTQEPCLAIEFADLPKIDYGVTY